VFCVFDHRGKPWFQLRGCLKWTKENNGDVNIFFYCRKGEKCERALTVQNMRWSTLWHTQRPIRNGEWITMVTGIVCVRYKFTGNGSIMDCDLV